MYIIYIYMMHIEIHLYIYTPFYIHHHNLYMYNCPSNFLQPSEHLLVRYHGWCFLCCRRRRGRHPKDVQQAIASCRLGILQCWETTER